MLVHCREGRWMIMMACDGQRCFNDNSKRLMVDKQVANCFQAWLLKRRMITNDQLKSVIAIANPLPVVQSTPKPKPAQHQLMIGSLSFGRQAAHIRAYASLFGTIFIDCEHSIQSHTQPNAHTYILYMHSVLCICVFSSKCACMTSLQGSPCYFNELPGRQLHQGETASSFEAFLLQRFIQQATHRSLQVWTTVDLCQLNYLKTKRFTWC